MIRFLQQFEQGSGDYAKQRHGWVDKTSMEELRKTASTLHPRGRKRG